MAWDFFVMENTTAEEAVNTLRSLFACMGLPDQIMSDNGPQLTSETFWKFATANGVKPVAGAPHIVVCSSYKYGSDIGLNRV